MREEKKKKKEQLRDAHLPGNGEHTRPAGWRHLKKGATGKRPMAQPDGRADEKIKRIINKMSFYFLSNVIS